MSDKESEDLKSCQSLHKSSSDVIHLIDCLIEDLTYKDKVARLKRLYKPSLSVIGGLLNAFADCTSGLFENDIDSFVASLQYMWGKVSRQKGIQSYCDVLRLIKMCIRSQQQQIDKLLLENERLRKLLSTTEAELRAFEAADADIYNIEKNETNVSSVILFIIVIWTFYSKTFIYLYNYNADRRRHSIATSKCSKRILCQTLT